MIKKVTQSAIVETMSELMISSDNVAHVLGTNSLSHGMLILSTVTYSMIPVLSPKSKLLGLISMPMMIKAVTTIESIEINRMDDILISEVMDKNPVMISENESFERVLHLLVDHNFLCVVDDERYFKGIITRKAMLKRINAYLHKS